MIFIEETIKNINRFSSKDKTFILQIFSSIDNGSSDDIESINSSFKFVVEMFFWKNWVFKLYHLCSSRIFSYALKRRSIETDTVYGPFLVSKR